MSAMPRSKFRELPVWGATGFVPEHLLPGMRLCTSDGRGPYTIERVWGGNSLTLRYDNGNERSAYLNGIERKKRPARWLCDCGKVELFLTPPRDATYPDLGAFTVWARYASTQRTQAYALRDRLAAALALKVDPAGVRIIIAGDPQWIAWALDGRDGLRKTVGVLELLLRHGGDEVRQLLIVTRRDRIPLNLEVLRRLATPEHPTAPAQKALSGQLVLFEAVHP